MGSIARRRSATRRERPRPATTAERWRLLGAIERSRSAGGAGVSGGRRNATLGSVAREPQQERRVADCYAITPNRYRSMIPIGSSFPLLYSRRLNC